MRSFSPSFRKGENAVRENFARRLASDACTIGNTNRKPGAACKCLDGFDGKITWDGTKHSGICTAPKYSYPYATSYYLYAENMRNECTNPPTNPTNGNVEFSNANKYNSVATFTCQTGYTLNAVQPITCSATAPNMPWPTPTISPECTLPVPDCTIDNSNKQLGSECKCVPGFTGDITWDGSAYSGTCTATQCTSPPAKPDNGDVAFTGVNQDGSVATFSCNTGYELVNSVAITCDAVSADMPWPTPAIAPECALAVICGNGVVQGDEQCECDSKSTDCR